MQLHQGDVINGTLTVYGVGRYSLDPNGHRIGPMDSVRLYRKVGPAKALRTSSQKNHAHTLALYHAWPQRFSYAPQPEQWVVFEVTGAIQEIP